MGYVTYNSEYKLLICKEHQCGIQPKWLVRHFREDHKGLGLMIRQEIFNYASELTLVEPEELQHPHNPVYYAKLVSRVSTEF
jgi:hypothetical protein